MTTVVVGAVLVVAHPTGASAPMVRPHLLAPGVAPGGAAPLGSVPPSEHISLKIVLPPSHEATLAALLQNLYTPGSPQYEQWLPAGQFQREFAPSGAAVSSVENWLRSKGLQGNASGFTIAVSGPAGRLASDLGTKFERYRTRSGHVGYVASQAPQVPASLAGGQISAVVGLDTLDPATPEGGVEVARAVTATSDVPVQIPQADGITPCAAAQSDAVPSYVTLDTLGADYGVGSLLSAGQNGHGQTVGLYELDPYSVPDVAAYESCFGLSDPVSRVTVDGGPTGTGGYGEPDIDIEQVATQAPGASIISYEGPNSPTGSYDVWNTIVSTDAAKVVSTSWGVCESVASAQGQMASFSSLFEQAAAQGQTIVAASGDSGAEDCLKVNGSTSAAVDYPASDPWVTAAGGTTRSSASDVVWNSCQSSESASCAKGSLGAGGGGLSQFETRPPFEPAFLSGSGGQQCGSTCREVPDISDNAGQAMVVYVGGAWNLAGGTSLTAPFIAGIAADRNDGCASSTGLFASSLFALYDLGAYGTAFTDVTSGNNDLTGTNGGAYAAGTGYDVASGIGTPLAGGLSCPEIASVGAGAVGSQVTVSGLGLEHATIDFGSTPAQVMSASSTGATVVVPAGSGTVTVRGSSVLGTGTVTASFTYSGSGGGTSPPGPSPSPSPNGHGFWLVGSDGGIFSFGSAHFYGSTGALKLQRPVVGITPTADRGGYWLVASDGGIFSFGDSAFYGSIPKLGLAPAGTPGAAKQLSAPIVGMVPTSDGRGYFMVGADGGVFAFGDALFEGSCPGMGGCSGAAVAVMPDASGNGYWLVTTTGHVYTFGDAAYFGAPGPQSSPVTSAVRTPDGRGYWILFANGSVFAYGDAALLGNATASVKGLNIASTIFSTSDGGGYWVATANGTVDTFGDAPAEGDLVGTSLNGSIVAGSGS